MADNPLSGNGLLRNVLPSGGVGVLGQMGLPGILPMLLDYFLKKGQGQGGPVMNQQQLPQPPAGATPLRRESGQTLSQPELQSVARRRL